MARGFRLEAKARQTEPKKGEVTIYSAISDWKWGDNDPTVTSNEFLKDLAELDADEITVRINSPGGIVSEAIAIRTALNKHPAVKKIDIEGCCASAATLIACLPGAHVRIAKGAEYMIHRCMAGIYGNQDRLKSALQSCENTDRQMADIYAARTGKTAEECMKLMKAESWFTAEDAVKEGFADELIPEEGGDVALAACVVSPEEDELMRGMYTRIPEGKFAVIAPMDQQTAEDGPQAAQDAPGRAEAKQTGECEGDTQTAPEGQKNGSNAEPAVAAGSDATSNRTEEGETSMGELKTATADMLREQNPELVAEIANAAIAAERGRIARIDKLTPKGAKFAELAKTAKNDGMSVEDYLEKVIELQAQAGEEYMEARKAETAPAAQIGAGDSKDNDGEDAEAKMDQIAKEIAQLAGGMSAQGVTMA